MLISVIGIGQNFHIGASLKNKDEQVHKKLGYCGWVRKLSLRAPEQVGGNLEAERTLWIL